MNFIQLEHINGERRVGLVEGTNVSLLVPAHNNLYALLKDVIDNGDKLDQVLNELKSDDQLVYDEVYNLRSDWKILPPIDVPDAPMMCVLSGTGLTHKTSADNRQKMHLIEDESELTDSMKMYLLGEEGGKPVNGSIGVQPEWFFKGNGTNLVSCYGHLDIPAYADDGGEEPEIAGVYIISSKGIPHRVGFVQANEFSDHVMEQKNYLYLAPSKLRKCAIGPELVTDLNFDQVFGEVKIVRDNSAIWTQTINSGEDNMAHSLANLEYHHFKYKQHRIPGQLHIHFFGADAFSFGQNISLEQGDTMHIQFEGMGRPLINELVIEKGEEKPVEIKTLE